MKNCGTHIPVCLRLVTYNHADLAYTMYPHLNYTTTLQRKTITTVSYTHLTLPTNREV